MTQKQQSTYEELSSRFRQALVASMLQTEPTISPEIQQAFLSVPREAFVPSFYVEDASRQNMAWGLVSADHWEPEDYLRRVYQNEPLVTKVDDRGWPISSSSQPLVMARMLEALAVQPGQRVLEIGTGSGYHAALLASLVGDPHQIVTMEYDEALATTARHALTRAFGEGVTVVVGDGVPGYEQGGPYDRIIATASAPTLPLAWIEQLQPDGRLVMDLQGPLASGFLVVEKHGEMVMGRVLSTPLYFMPLRSEKIAVSKRSKAALLQQPCSEMFLLEQDQVFPDVLCDPAFRWFVQWRCPCQISTQKQRESETGSWLHTHWIMALRSQALVRLQRRDGQDTWNGSVYGPSSLWHDLQQAWDDFCALGKPNPQEYTLSIEEDCPILHIGTFRLELS